MNCFPCFHSEKSKSLNGNEEVPVAQPVGADHPANAPPPAASPVHNNAKQSHDSINVKEEAGKTPAAKTFTFRELASATKNFRTEFLLGEGGFGRMYKATLSGQVVAVKQLDRNGMQGSKEFATEVSSLCLLNHPNLIKLIGYCADGDQRLLVYEYLPYGSVKDHLFGDKQTLDWVTRMKIASGAAQGIEYLHEKAKPPVLYRDLKSSNILLDDEGNPRLSDFGLSKLGLGGGKTTLTPRVVGNYGYCAPEYERTGELTVKSDVYSFGVVLLELITGRRAIDTTKQADEQNLVSWAQPYFRNPKKFPEMADPLLNARFSVKSLNQAVGVAAMCLQEEPAVRPEIGDVVAALSFLTLPQDDFSAPVPDANQPSEDAKPSVEKGNSSDGESSGSEEEEEEDDDDDGDGSDDSGSDDNENESPQVKTKKTVKWASKCKSNGKSQDESVGSTSNRSHGSGNESHDRSCGQNSVSKSSSWRSNSRKSSKKVKSEDVTVGSSSGKEDKVVESKDKNPGQNLKPNSSKKLGSASRRLSKAKSRDASFHSSSSHNSYIGSNGDWGSDSDSGWCASNGKPWSANSDSSSSDEESDAGFQGTCRQNDGVSPKHRAYSSNSRQGNSNSMELKDERVDTKSRQNSNKQSRAWSIRSTSSNAYGEASSFKSQTGYEDGNLGSAAGRNSNAGSEDGSSSD